MAIPQFISEQKGAIGASIRLGGAWGSVGITNLVDVTAWAHAVAEIGAAVLTVGLVLEFLVKKVIFPLYDWWTKRRSKRGDK